MRLPYRTVAALVGTVIAVAIAISAILLDIYTDPTGAAGDAAAQGAPAVLFAAIVLFPFYFAIASLPPTLKDRPYVSAAVAVAIAAIALLTVPSAVWVFATGTTADLVRILVAVVMIICWLTPGALVQLAILHRLATRSSRRRNAEYA
jgi:hypothetical protein